MDAGLVAAAIASPLAAFLRPRPFIENEFVAEANIIVVLGVVVAALFVTVVVLGAVVCAISRSVVRLVGGRRRSAAGSVMSHSAMSHSAMFRPAEFIICFALFFSVSAVMASRAEAGMASAVPGLARGGSVQGVSGGGVGGGRGSGGSACSPGSGTGQDGLAGKQDGLPGELVDTIATLVDDPQRWGQAVAVLLEIDGSRYQAVAYRGAAATLGRHLAGERVRVSGRCVAGWEGDRERWRHVVGHITVESAEPGPPGAPVFRGVAAVHRLLQQSAKAMGSQGTLYRGLVVGDDRDISPEIREAFRSAGMTHLTAVSGQNVAFVLILLGPLIRGLSLRSRKVAALVAIAWFVLVTRAEPSVLRAGAMASVSILGRERERRSAGLRTLGSSIAVLVLADPFLVRSVGLWLSVLASAGILLGSEPIADRIPGPRVVASAASVTIAAQIATTPLLVAIFGSVPLAALPANLLAGPLAGPVMMWGMSGGMLAGLLGGGWCAVLQAPARVAVRWLEMVALSCSELPLGELNSASLVWVLTVALVVSVLRLAGGPRRRSGNSTSRSGPDR